jgi:hypothetical protein
MPSPKAARTTRRFLKLASLGIAGLIVGLLSGCTSTPTSSTVATYTQPSSLDFNFSTRQPTGLYTNPTPSLRHAPIPHRIESWADQTPHQTSVFPVRSNPEPTFTNYAFTNTHSQSGPGANLTAQ